MDFYFSILAFKFMLTSMVQSLVILSLLWCVAEHFALEDPKRSLYQKNRILKGTFAGLFWVLIFIAPVLLIKVILRKDFVGSNRLLMMGIYESISVIIFTWVGIQLHFMYMDGVAMKKDEYAIKQQSSFAHPTGYSVEQYNLSPVNSVNLKRKNWDVTANDSTLHSITTIDTNVPEATVQRPVNARVGEKTFDYKDDTFASGVAPEPISHIQYRMALNKLFPTEKRGLTFMHFISSSIAYFVFLEPYLFIMQFSPNRVAIMLVPFFIALIISIICAAVAMFALKRVSLYTVFFCSVVWIIGSSAHLVNRATKQFTGYLNAQFNANITDRRVDLLSNISVGAYIFALIVLLITHSYMRRRRTA